MAGREVTEQEFWQAVKTCTRNIHPRVEGPFPYTSVFEFIDNNSREEFGRVVESFTNGVHPIVSRHFLNA